MGEKDVCRVCGCTEEQACSGGCFWIEKDGDNSICSACVNPEVAEEALRENYKQYKNLEQKIKEIEAEAVI